MLRFLEPCDLEIWRMTFKNNRAPLLCYFKLCASFRSHWWIQTGVTVWKRPIWVKLRRFLEPCDLKIWRMTFIKANLRDLIAATGLVISNCIQIVNFSARVTGKFDGWACKTIWHLFYATSSFVQHFVPIGEFKLQLQSGNAQFGSKSTIFWAVLPRNFTDDPQQGKSEGFDSCDRPSNITQIGFKSIFQPLWPWNLMDDQKKQ